MPSAFREGFMSDSIKFGGVTLDCPHVGELAAFYAEITGGEVGYLFPGIPRLLTADLARRSLVGADAPGL
jgi:hypothetical protein